MGRVVTFPKTGPCPGATTRVPANSSRPVDWRGGTPARPPRPFPFRDFSRALDIGDHDRACAMMRDRPGRFADLRDGALLTPPERRAPWLSVLAGAAALILALTIFHDTPQRVRADVLRACQSGATCNE